MKPKKILWLLIFIILTSLQLSHSSELGLIPTDFLVENTSQKNRREALELNKTLKMEDFDLCHYEKNVLVTCYSPDSEAKFLINPTTQNAYGVLNDRENDRFKRRKLTQAEKAYVTLLLEYLRAVMPSNKVHVPVNQNIETSTLKNITNIENIGILNTTSSSQDWCSDSPDIFPLSCQQHDYCYSSGSPKSVCDSVFYENMYNEAHSYTINSTEPNFELLANYLAVAYIYFEAVVHSSIALNAFCSTTPVDFDLCDSGVGDLVDQNDNEHNSGTNGGTEIDGGYSGGSGTTGGVSSYGFALSVNYVCSLWRFPDGNGGYYYLFRECMVTFSPQP